MTARDLSVGFTTMMVVGLSIALMTGLTYQRLSVDESKVIDASKLQARGVKAENRQNEQAETLNVMILMGKFPDEKLDEVLALNNSSSSKISAAYFEYLLCVQKKDNSYCERADVDLIQGSLDMDRIDEMIKQSQEISL